MASSPPTSPSGLGEAVRRLRLLNGWSQAELAAAANLSIDQVRGLERGKRQIGADGEERLAKALGISSRRLSRFAGILSV